MKLTLAEVRKNVPSIHVFKVEGESNGVKHLTPQEHDSRYYDYDQPSYSLGYTKGDGSRDNPYTYESAVPVSPYYAIIDLWLKFRLKKLLNNNVALIRVNHWLLELHLDGVVAEDGHHTRLLPE
jgi:hypothetical protein